MEVHTLKILKDSKRDAQVITDPQKLEYILKEYVGNTPLGIRNTEPVVHATPKGMEKSDEYGYVLLLEFPADYPVPNQLTLFKTLKRQMEFDCELIEEGTNGVKMRVLEVRIDTNPRKQGRLINPDDSIVSSNFYISKNKIDMNPMWYSVSNRVIFHEEEKRLSARIAGLKIREMNPIDNRWESKILKKAKQGFIVTDLKEAKILWEQDILGTSKSIELPKIADEAVEAMRKMALDEGLKSAIYYPILYTNLQQQTFPIGYLYLESKEKELTKQDMQTLKEAAEEVLKRIKDANTIFLKERQAIVNIGLGGALLKITDPEFQQYILNRNEMVFDVIFKMQQPLRFYAEIKHIRQKDTGELYVGVEFKGLVYSEHSGMTSFERLKEYIEYMVQKGAPYEAPIAS
ncbi:MAG: DUF1577 domain-containing protein [Candidatus Hydrogenedentota bacterium]|nr:MAG: DUF1577 domain-containing protein [Candidatus Hydrogenedentota bacterium]